VVSGRALLARARPRARGHRARARRSHHVLGRRVQLLANAATAGGANAGPGRTGRPR